MVYDWSRESGVVEFHFVHISPPITASMIGLDDCIQVDLGRGIQGNCSPRNKSEPTVDPDLFLGSIHQGPNPLDRPFKINWDAGIWGNHAGSECIPWIQFPWGFNPRSSQILLSRWVILVVRERKHGFGPDCSKASEPTYHVLALYRMTLFTIGDLKQSTKKVSSEHFCTFFVKIIILMNVSLRYLISQNNSHPSM